MAWIVVALRSPEHVDPAGWQVVVRHEQRDPA
jgi:hypothetical protein